MELKVCKRYIKNEKFEEEKKVWRHGRKRSQTNEELKCRRKYQIESDSNY